ncbi:ras-related protein Rab-38-like [Bombina bombina]|uniref:ras-related protein Rab-38-like n=1 Tax=Bombina bombina TaxID=8345 RepID=UPI00235A79CB|nr:ras-related protein Rab-38-like [Bombina bombina]
MGSPQREYLFKVLVVGDIGVGKTSIIQRYVHNIYSQCYRATIGVDFALKVLNWEPKCVVRLQLWDIAGQERFGHMTRLYYREAVGALVVCDLGRAATLESVRRWKEDLDSKVYLQSGKPIPVMLLANKCDQMHMGVSTLEIEELVRELEFTDYHLTSAKENVNIDEAISCLIKEMIDNEEESEPRKDPNVVQPSLLSPSTRHYKGCTQCSGM